MNKPNILFIIADQLGAASLGCYGSGVDSTPTLDRLVRVMAASRLVPQYRNMPLVEGRKQVPVRSQFSDGAPLYEGPPSPFLHK